MKEEQHVSNRLQKSSPRDVVWFETPRRLAPDSRLRVFGIDRNASDSALRYWGVKTTAGSQ